MLVLTLIFFAALVGVFKPYLKNLKRKHFGVAAAVAFIGMMIASPKPQTTDARAVSSTAEEGQGNASGSNGDGADDATTASTVQPETPDTKWIYQDEKDEMRGTTTSFAIIKSENTVDLDFPYGEQQGKLAVRRGDDGLTVLFTVDEGQILCNSFTNTSIAVKFDDGPIQKMRCSDANDGSSNVGFFRNGSGMLKGLKSAKKTIIEAEFYQQGRQQFVFETAGLNWK